MTLSTHQQENNMTKAVGYMRVSQSSQTVENQKIELLGSNMSISEWFSDEGVSGNTPQMERKGFRQMSKILEWGDTLVISKMDRLGRDATDVMNTVKELQARGIKIVVLQFGTMDVTSVAGKLFMHVIAAVAEMEMGLLKERIHAGLVRAREQGVVMGAPTKIAPEVMKAICADKAKGLTLDQVADKHGVDRSTASRNIRRWKDNLEGYEKEFQSRTTHIAVKRAKMFGE